MKCQMLVSFHNPYGVISWEWWVPWIFSLSFGFGRAAMECRWEWDPGVSQGWSPSTILHEVPHHLTPYYVSICFRFVKHICLANSCKNCWRTLMRNIMGIPSITQDQYHPILANWLAWKSTESSVLDVLMHHWHSCLGISKMFCWILPFVTSRDHHFLLSLALNWSSCSPCTNKQRAQWLCWSCVTGWCEPGTRASPRWILMNMSYSYINAWAFKNQRWIQ